VSRRDDLIGGAYAAIASLAFGAVAVVGKIVTDRGMTVTSLLGVRFGVAAIVLALVQGVRRGPLRPARGEWWRLLLLGVAGYALESGLFFAALRHGTVSAVTLLFFTYPVFVAIGSVLLGRGLPGWVVVGSLVVALAGAATVAASAGGVDISALGVLFALLASFAFAVYLVAAEALLERTPPQVGATWVAGAASLGLFTAALVSRTGDLPPSGAKGWVMLGFMGAGTALAFTGLFGAVQRLGAVRTAVVSALEPATTALMGVAFLGDPLRTGTVVGGVLILVAAFAASVARGIPTAEAPVA